MLLPYLAIGLLIVVTLYSAIVSFRQPPEGAKPNWIFPAGAKRLTRIVAVAILAFMIGLGAWVGIGTYNASRRSSRFLIPEGYTGWVRVEFEVPGTPALPVEAGQILVKIPPSGSLTTSSLEQYGWAKDSYYYYAGSDSHPIPDTGPQAEIWGRINGEAAVPSGKRKYEEFFVGTEKQFKDQALPGNTLKTAP